MENKKECDIYLLEYKIELLDEINYEYFQTVIDIHNFLRCRDYGENQCIYNFVDEHNKPIIRFTFDLYTEDNIGIYIDLLYRYLYQATSKLNDNNIGRTQYAKINLRFLHKY